MDPDANDGLDDVDFEEDAHLLRFDSGSGVQRNPSSQHPTPTVTG